MGRWASRGDTLVEVVIALAILSVTFAVAYNVADMSYRTAVQARESTVAAELIQDQAEKLRAYRDQLVAVDSANASPSDVFTSANFPATMYVSQDSTKTKLQANSGATTGSAACFGLPTCKLSVTVSQPHPLENGVPLLDEVQAVIDVKWTSLIGSVTNDSQVTYYLTDTRAVTAPCDNSLAGSCQ